LPRSGAADSTTSRQLHISNSHNVTSRGGNTTTANLAQILAAAQSSSTNQQGSKVREKNDLRSATSALSSHFFSGCQHTFIDGGGRGHIRQRQQEHTQQFVVQPFQPTCQLRREFGQFGCAYQLSCGFIVLFQGFEIKQELSSFHIFSHFFHRTIT
jgi:hypothetical protein